MRYSAPKGQHIIGTPTLIDSMIPLKPQWVKNQPVTWKSSVNICAGLTISSAPNGREHIAEGTSEKGIPIQFRALSPLLRLGFAP